MTQHFQLCQDCRILQFQPQFHFWPSTYDFSHLVSPSDINSSAGAMFCGVKAELSTSWNCLGAAVWGICSVTTGLQLSPVSGLWRFLHIALSSKALLWMCGLCSNSRCLAPNTQFSSISGPWGKFFSLKTKSIDAFISNEQRLSLSSASKACISWK